MTRKKMNKEELDRISGGLSQVDENTIKAIEQGSLDVRKEDGSSTQGSFTLVRNNEGQAIAFKFVPNNSE